MSGAAAFPPAQRARRHARPRIVLLESEAEALTSLALAALERSSFSAELLLEELERAETRTPRKLPRDVVTMHAQIAFRDEATGEEHAVQLVFPKEADMELGKVSVLTPIGAALIGMRRGAAIDWPNRHGEWRRLRIVEVAQPPREN